MNVDQVYQALRSESDDILEALQWALDHWDEASDRLLSKLRSLCVNFDDDVEGSNALFFLMHLFAEKKDVRAYAPLCARLARDRKAEEWLGDAIFRSLSKVLISLYDGDLAPILALIESEEADESVRGAAIGSFGYLVRCAAALPDSEAQAFLKRFYETGLPREESEVWLAWTMTASRLGYSELAADAARLFSRNWVDDSYSDIEEFHASIARARAAPTDIFAEDDLEPFGSTMEFVELYLSGDEDDESFDLDDEAKTGAYGQGVPIVNPNRDVGRNDPCPCGSGKKFKKCCLAA